MQRPWLRLLDPELHELELKAGAAPEARLPLAKALNARCRHGEAVAILEGLLTEQRAHPEAWFERIVAAGESASAEDLSGLHRELEALRDEAPQDAAPRRNLGFVRILQQRPDDAERALKQSLERDGHDPRTLELMGLLSLQREHSAEAKAWFLKALSLQPKDPRTLRLLGLTCEQLGDHKGAEQQFAAAIEADAAYFWGWHSLGELLLRRGETEDAFRCLNRARALSARESATYFILAEIFAEQGHLEMAQGELHKLMALAPPASVLAEAHAMLGEIRRDLGDREGAISYLSLATETDPDLATPWVTLGDMAREDGRWEDALRCYREALARKGDAADVLVQAGYMLLKLNQPAESEHSFLAALESDPGEYSAYLGLSEVYRFLHRLEDQIRMVEEARTLAPDDPDVWNARGVAMEVAGRNAEATEAYEHALSLAPGHRKAANNLGFVLEKRMVAGEPELRDRAIEAWKLRFLLCRDEGASLKMAAEHLSRLGVPAETLETWMASERTPEGA